MVESESLFFREATLRICGHLDIEVALQRSVKFLQNYMPADLMYLEIYQWDLGSMLEIAKATPEKGEKLELLVPLPEEARNLMHQLRENWEQRSRKDVYIINRPDEYPISKSVLKYLDIPGWAHMLMPLILDNEPIGWLVLLAEGLDRYAEEHARLLSLLKEPYAIAMANALEHRRVQKLKSLLADDNRFLNRELFRISGDDIIGADFGLKHVMDLVRQVSSLDSPVLLLGETGVGKDVIANAIHFSSPRRDSPFIPVNSGAIPDSLLDSELFGHEKGAFTGAISQKRGRFERAHTGTIFLDEIGELPPQAQVRMLRVLEEKEIERVGGSKPISVDTRIIAATHRNLEEMVQTDEFRKDLWFRLNVFPIVIPPLRARKEDIPALLRHFIKRKSGQLRLHSPGSIAPGEIEVLLAYDWPGNVRELENLVERALILHHDGPLRFSHLMPGAREVRNRSFNETAINMTSQKLDDVVRSHIEQVLKSVDGRVHGDGGAADLLGINPSTLRNKMNKLGIRYGRRA